MHSPTSAAEAPDAATAASAKIARTQRPTTLMRFICSLLPLMCFLCSLLLFPLDMECLHPPRPRLLAACTHYTLTRTALGLHSIVKQASAGLSSTAALL